MNKLINKIIQGEALEELKKLPDESIDMIITSPPYYALRNYGVNGQIGLEPTFQEYINKLCDIFDEAKRVLKKEGTCWVNIGDSYSGQPAGNKKPSVFQQKHQDSVGVNYLAQATNIYPDPKNPASLRAREQVAKQSVPKKCLMQIPARFAIEMTNRGWILRNKIIWFKPNAMPSSVKDRFTVDFEEVLFFVKSKKYYFEQQFEKCLTQETRLYGIIRNREYGYDSKLNKLNKKEYTIRQKRGGNKNPDYLNPSVRNKRTIWKINTKPYKEAHFAVYPEELIKTPIKAGCPKGGIVLDMFMGSGTTALMAKKLDRNYIGIELNKDYINIAKERINNIQNRLL